MRVSLQQNICSRLTCALAVIVMLIAFSSPALADCSNDGSCAYVPAGSMVPVMVGSTLPGSPSNTAVVAADPVCEAVTNNCGADIMVPHKFNDEWSSFITNHESCAALAACPIITTLMANPTTVLGGSTTKLTWTVLNPYGLATTCTSSSSDNSWPYTAVSASGGSQNVRPYYNSNTRNQSTVTYTLNCSDSAHHTGSSSQTITIDPDGACGSANGGGFSSLTDSDASLCSTFNTASNFTPTSSGWSWWCTPSFDSDGVPCSASGACAATEPDHGTLGAFPGCDISCDNGYSWDSNSSSCVATCNPSSVANGTVNSNCSITCDNGYMLSGSSCVAGTSGSVTLELYWDEIWRTTAPTSFKEFIGIVPNNSCSPGENYTITGVTTSISPTAPDATSAGLSALGNTITGKTFQCQNVTVEIGVGADSGYATEFGIGFLSTVYGESAYGYTPYARSIGVIKYDGSLGALTPNSSYLLTTTSWSGP